MREGVRGRLLILRRQRVLGLLDERLVLSRRERLVIEGYAGPVIGRIGAPDDEPEDVRAVFADWPGGERPDEPLGLEWKRRSIWGNPERNEATARLATALADGDLGTLWAYGLFLDGEPVLRPPADRRVAVLVESPEHARILGRLLPGWAVLCADGADLAAVGRAGAAGAGPDDRGDMPGRAIVTWLHADRRGRIEADVVIRADGTALAARSARRGAAAGTCRGSARAARRSRRPSGPDREGRDAGPSARLPEPRVDRAVTLGGTGTEVDLRMLVEHICHRTLESRRRTSCPARAVVGPGSRVRFPITRGPFVSGDDPGQADDDVPGLRGARGVMPPIVIGLAEAGWTGTIERASGRSDRMPAMRIGIRHRNPAQGRASARRRGRQGLG